MSIIYQLSEDCHGDLGDFSSIQEALDFMKEEWYVTKIKSVNDETEPEKIAQEYAGCEAGDFSIEIDTDNGLFWISREEDSINPPKVYVVMTDDGECIAIRGTRRDALMFIFEKAREDDYIGDDWREEYEVETVDEMLDEIDSRHSFDSMYVIECDNCQI